MTIRQLATSLWLPITQPCVCSYLLYIEQLISGEAPQNERSFIMLAVYLLAELIRRKIYIYLLLVKMFLIL